MTRKEQLLAVHYIGRMLRLIALAILGQYAGDNPNAAQFSAFFDECNKEEEVFFTLLSGGRPLE